MACQLYDIYRDILRHNLDYIIHILNSLECHGKKIEKNEINLLFIYTERPQYLVFHDDSKMHIVNGIIKTILIVIFHDICVFNKYAAMVNHDIVSAQCESNDNIMIYIYIYIYIYVCMCVCVCVYVCVCVCVWVCVCVCLCVCVCV